MTLATPQRTVAPLFVAPGNALSIVGQSWRWCRDFARAHGVEILRVQGKSLIRSVDLAAALEREASRTQPAPELDARAELQLRLGGTR